MTFSWDFNTATLLAIITQAVFVIMGLVRSDTRSKSAKEIALTAQKRADDAHDKIAIAGSAHAMFQVEIAREYVSHIALQQMENRLSDSLKELRKRLDEVLDRQGK